MIESSWRRRPACWVVLLLSAGILLAEFVRLPTRLMIGGFAAVLAFALLSRRSARLAVDRFLWSLAVILLGLTLSSIRRHEIAEDLLSASARGERIAIEGTIESEPAARKARIDVEVLTSRVERDSIGQILIRRLLVQIPTQADSLAPDSLRVGDVVRIIGTLEPFPGARNPGEFDYGRYLALNGVRGFVVADDSAGVRVLAREGCTSVNHLVGRSRKAIYKLFDRYHHPEESSLLKGVVFGYRGDLSDEVKQSFMLTGTIHILAVSGSNVAVVTLVFFSLIGFLRIPHRVATGLTLIGLLWYMVITGLSPSVIRATIMAGTILLGTVIGRKGDIYNSLAAAGLLMLLWDPLFLYDVGFQLSFAAVLSIVAFYPKLDGLIESLWGDYMRPFRILPILKLGAVSVAAQIGTLPFSAFYFGRVSLVAIVANLVVVPVSGINTLLGFATVLSSLFSHQFAACYAALNDLLVSFLLRFVLWSSQLPLASLEVSGYGVYSACFYYVLVLALFFFRKPLVIRILVFFALAVSNIWVFNEVVDFVPRQMRVTMLDVGQGDAILLEFSNGKRVLVDAGPRNPSFDAGARTIGPWLRRNGISTLDAIIITHAHDDHLGGCPFLLSDLTVRSLIVPDTSGVPKSVRALIDQANRKGVPIHVAHEGNCLQFDPLTRIFVLGPSEKQISDDPNDRSIVLKVLFGSSSLLLSGDASVRAESRMVLLAGPLLKSNVLKIAHHGAATSSGDLFLETVRPSLAVISVGRINKFNHPSPKTLERLRRFGVVTSRTDVDGAVILQSEGRELSLVRWRKLGFL
jgi:competence protein ComEC